MKLGCRISKITLANRSWYWQITTVTLRALEFQFHLYSRITKSCDTYQATDVSHVTEQVGPHPVTNLPEPVVVE